MVIFPVYVLIESWNEDFADLGHRGQSAQFDWTDAQGYFADATVKHETLLIILAVGEIVLLVLFILTFSLSMRS
jgi:hypothetical protein